MLHRNEEERGTSISGHHPHSGWAERVLRLDLGLAEVRPHFDCLHGSLLPVSCGGDWNAVNLH